MVPVAMVSTSIIHKALEVVASTLEEDTTILVVVVDLLTVEGEKVAAVVAAVDEVAFLISPSSPTRRSCQRVQSI